MSPLCFLRYLLLKSVGLILHRLLGVSHPVTLQWRPNPALPVSLARLLIVARQARQSFRQNGQNPGSPAHR